MAWETGRVPLDDMAVLICNARGLTYSNGLMTELARRGVAVVLCGPNYLPVAWLWPLEGHHVQALRMRCQLEASKPLIKRLWQSVVRAKITQQKNTLDLLEIPGGSLKSLARRVKSGDPDNVEAQAARRYWADAVRKRLQTRPVRPNAQLAPQLWIHRSQGGGGASGRVRRTPSIPRYPPPQPRQPNVPGGRPDGTVSGRWWDYAVACLVRSGCEEVTSDAKQALAGILTVDMNTDRGVSPLQTCLERAAQSLAQSFEDKTPSLTFPGRLAAASLPVAS